jgi:homoserine kinase type II
MSEDQKKLLSSEIEEQTVFRKSSIFKILPTAMVHGDLFKDNALFRKDFTQKDTTDKQQSTKKYQLSGLIDFYFAGTDVLCYDLAVALNDWAISTDEVTFGSFKKNFFDKMVSGYESIRELIPEEKKALPMMLRGAALRFWISRLFDWYQPREASLLSPKNPEQFEMILKKRRDETNYGNEQNPA